MALATRRGAAFATTAPLRASPSSLRAPVRPASRTRTALAPVLCQAAPSSGAAAAVAEVAAPAAPASGFTLAKGEVNSVNASDVPALHAAAQSSLVVVDVYTAWCGPCKMIAPEVEKMAQEFGNVIFTKMDATTVNENKKWAMAQNVKALPTFILFKSGQRVGDMTGAKAASLRKLVEAHM